MRERPLLLLAAFFLCSCSPPARHATTPERHDVSIGAPLDSSFEAAFPRVYESLNGRARAFLWASGELQVNVEFTLYRQPKNDWTAVASAAYVGSFADTALALNMHTCPDSVALAVAGACGIEWSEDSALVIRPRLALSGGPWPAAVVAGPADGDTLREGM